MRTNEIQGKHAQVVQYLQSHGLDGVLLTRRCNFSWYTCGARNYVGVASDAGNSHLLVTPDGATVITTNIEAPRLADEDLAGLGVQVTAYEYHDGAARKAMLASVVGSRKVAVDVPVGGVEAQRLGGDFDRLRQRLTQDEIVRYRGVCMDTVLAMEGTARRVEVGQSEHKIGAMLAESLMEKGLLPWVLLVACDERVEKYRHPLATDARVGRYFMLVTCAERGGLICACSRLASFEKLPAELERKHLAVSRVHAAMTAATQPGGTLGDVFAATQQAYADNGFDGEWRHHHQGGPTGYLPREGIAGEGDKTVMMADQAFAWNPSIAGTKCEDTILCTQDGPEVLSARTNWPTVDFELAGVRYKRPGILVIR